VLEEKGGVEEDAENGRGGEGREYSRRRLTLVLEEKDADDGCGRAKTGSLVILRVGGEIISRNTPSRSPPLPTQDQLRSPPPLE
jgi:hypothetical protein